jgi:tetraacyldisaccharide 4'-kinase
MSERTPPLGGPIGRALSAIYAGIVSRRNRAFDAGRGVVTLDRPVISVGNLSVGGTGKTPLVAHVLEVLGGAGRNPCVAMRGYGSGRGRESDEAMLYRDQFLSVRIVAQPDRVEGLLALLASDDGGHVDSVVLDDGFQHRRLARQVDLVLVDATRDPFADRPRLLRERRSRGSGGHQAERRDHPHAKRSTPSMPLPRGRSRIGSSVVAMSQWRPPALSRRP